LSRLSAWIKDPVAMDRDLQQADSAVRALRRELSRVHAEEDKWLNCFEMGRSQLSASLTRNREFNARLSREMKHLYALALAECGPTTRKRRNLCMRDCLEELHERQAALNTRIAEYDRLAYHALVAVAEKESKPADAAYALAKAIPMTRMTLSEDQLLDYPYDAELFAKQLYTSRASKGGDAAARKAAAAAEAADAAKAFRESVEEQRGAESHARLQLSAEQRDLVALVDIQRGASLPAVEGAAGAVNAAAKAACAAAAAEEEEKDKSARASRSKIEAAKGKEATAAADGVDEAAATAQGEADPSRELVSLFSGVEEAITFGRANLGDVDVFFGEEFSAADEKMRAAAARAGVAGLSSPRSPRSGSIVDDAIRDLGGVSAAMISAVCDVSGTLVPNGDKAAVLVAPLNALKTEADWTKHLDAMVNTVDGRGDNMRRKRRAQSTVHLQTFSYPRTPRGVPLLVSPLSQFEDRYLGAVYGGPTGTSAFNGYIKSADNVKLPYTCSLLPTDLEREENRVILHCRLQSASAFSETKIRRLRSSLAEAKKQAETAEMASSRSERVYVHTLLEDTIECKRIRRELQTFGIAALSSSSQDMDTPMSPLAETSGWNSLSSSNGRNGGGAAGGRGLPWGRHKKKHTSQAEKLVEALHLQASQEQAVREAALYRHDANQRGQEPAVIGGKREEEVRVTHVPDAGHVSNGSGSGSGSGSGDGSTNGDAATEESEPGADKPPPKKRDARSWTGRSR